MKKLNIKILFGCYAIVGVLCLIFLKHERFWYDLVLRYFNFGIIVIVFIKYAKTPLMNFLRGQKEQLARELKKIEDKKKEATDKIEMARITLEESQERFAELKERIVLQGKKKKQEIIEEAQHLSEVMIEDTKRKIEYQILKARDTIRAQMLDAAIDLAIERLPKEITDADNEKFIDQYISVAMPD